MNWYDNCELAATDGHRLAVASVAENFGNGETITEPQFATIPYQSLRELEKLLNSVSKNCNCTVSIGKAQAIFALPNVRVTTRLLEGQYPPYPSLVPQQFQHQFMVSKQTLESAVARVAIVALDKNHTTKFAFNLKEKYVSISAESQANGSAMESVAIEIDSDCQNNFNLGLNILYLIDSLKHISAPEIIILANQPTAPVIVTPAGSSFNSLVLLMPLQLTADEEVSPPETTPKAETPIVETPEAEEINEPAIAGSQTSETPEAEIPEQKATQPKSNKKKPLAA